MPATEQETAPAQATADPLIDAPIIVTASEKDVLKSFMQGLTTDNRTIAQRESARLAPYFTTFSRYLADALAARREKESTMGLRPSDDTRLRALIKPESLTAMFNGVADYNRNTILSQISIVPDSFLRDKELSEELFDDKQLYGGDTLYNGHNFNFGFVQLCARNAKGKAVSSVSFPLLALDTPMLELVAPHAPQALLGGLKAVMNNGNHDMLHHLTNEIINSTISFSFHREGLRSYFGLPHSNKPLWAWDKSTFSTGRGDSHPHSYETWLVMTQEMVRKRAESEPGPQQGQVAAAIDICCRELARIGAALQESAATPEEGARNAHNAVDYFGSMVAFALLRFQPLTSPDIGKLLEAMEKADPLSGTADRKCLFGILWERARSTANSQKQAEAYKDMQQTTGIYGIPADTTMLLHENLGKVLANDTALRDTFAGCAAMGGPLAPPEGGAFSYAQAKRIELARIAPWLARVCSAPESQAMSAARTRTPQAALGMVEAVAKMLKFQPAGA